MLIAKSYKYIPELLNVICQERKLTTITMKYKRPLSSDHPARIQETIAHKPPEATEILVANKRSRFS